MTGIGQLILNGANTYAGNTQVNAGILSVNGSIVSPVTVSNSATLKGTGTISNTVTIQSGCTISPGNSIGTLTIDTLDLNSGSITNIEINPSGASSSLNITTHANIDGMVQFVVDPGDYAPSQIFTFETGPYSGTFSSSSLPLLGYNYSILYNTNLIQLYINRPVIQTKGLKGNAKKVAKYFNKNSPITPAYSTLTSLSGKTLQNALNAVSPARNALPVFVGHNVYFALSDMIITHINQQKFLRAYNVKDERLLTDLLSSHESEGYLAERSKIPSLSFAMNSKKNSCEVSLKKTDQKTCADAWKEPYRLWLGAFAEYSYEKEQHQTPPFHAITEGALIAFDSSLSSCCPAIDGAFSDSMAGGAIGYANGYIHESWHLGHASMNYYYASLYGMIRKDAFYMDGVIWGGYQQIKNERHILYPGYKGTAKARYHAWQLSPHIEFGGDIDMSWGGLQPFTAFEFANSWQEGFQEHGADGMNMRERGDHSSMLKSAIGLRAFEYWSWSWGSLLMKEEIDYINKKPFRMGKISTTLVGSLIPSGPFDGLFVETLTTTQNLGAVGVEFLFKPNQSKYPEFSLGYYGEFGAEYFGQELILKIVKLF